MDTDRTIYDWRWDTVGVVYGQKDKERSFFCLQAARDFAIHGDAPVVLFTDKNLKVLRGILYSKWPELGGKEVQEVFVLDYQPGDRVADRLRQAMTVVAFRTNRGVPRKRGLVIFDYKGASDILRQPQNAAAVSNTPTLFTRPVKTHFPLPREIALGAYAILEVEGGEGVGERAEGEC